MLLSEEKVYNRLIQPQLRKVFLVFLTLILLSGCQPAAFIATPITSVVVTLPPTATPTPVPTLQASPTAIPASPIPTSSPTLPDGERWLMHLKGDLLPFWDREEALGNPVGNFPSKRCDDGTLFHSISNPCPEIANNGWLSLDLEYVVSRSRQTYGYGVAYHLTGDPRYLEYAKAGVEYLRRNAFDRLNGGVFHYWDGHKRAWLPGPQHRNPQELAYALLGLSFYYYLTRDPEVLPDILAVKETIFQNYYNPDLNALQWMMESTDDTNALDKRLVAQLDNLNAYMVLMTPLLPESEQKAWKADMVRLARIIIDEFYSEDENLFFLTANTPSEKSLAHAGTDFGHSIKAMWMIYYVGLIADEPHLVAFAEENGPRMLERAYLEESGSWANGVERGGTLIRDKEWWVYDELDQFAMVFALRDPSQARYLPQTTDYYFRYFVDPAYGEVWTAVDARTNSPKQDALPKAWPWKSAYHSFEHALIGYITAQQLYGQPVTLYYAFKTPPDEPTIQPYFLRGDLIELGITQVDGVNVYRAQFQNIR